VWAVLGPDHGTPCLLDHCGESSVKNRSSLDVVWMTAR
jgi:hypothetical protein